MQSKQSSGLRSRKRELADKLATLFLVIVGIISLLIALASIFDPVDKFVIAIVPALGLMNLSGLLLLLFSAIALAIGLERYANLDEVRIETQNRHSEVIQAISHIQQISEQHGLNLAKDINEIRQTLNAVVEAQVLLGPEAVYAEAIRLIRACEGSEIIRATSLDQFTTLESYTELENIPIYKSYLETLAKKISQTKHDKIGMVYRVVIGFRPNEKGELPPGSIQIVQKRREFFKSNNALDKLEIKWLDSFWSLDLMIVGDTEMIIMFPTNIGDRHYRLAIRITHETFVSHLTRWYDERPWREAKDLVKTGEEVK